MPKKISLTLTTAAQTALTRLISQITEYRAVATVAWSEGGSRINKGITTPLPPSWGVAFQDRAQLPGDEIQQIGGIEFIFMQGAISERLNGKTLDWNNGRFRVRKDGI